MKQLYLLSHKTTSLKDPRTSFLKSKLSGRLISQTIFLLTCFFANHLISQTPQVPFNASFWNGYADKLQLGPKERLEFISAHQREYNAATTVSASVQQSPPNNNKTGSGNSVYAGPCVNADFELGNLSGWTRSCGFHAGYNPLGCCPNPNGQQTIMSGTGTDPYGGFPLVYPGGSFSLRLGNNGTNGQADAIEQTFLVSTANANFSYKYAVVFEDPNHPTNQQPYFQVEMVDSVNAPIPCTFYYVAAGTGIPGFFNSPTSGVIYKPWSTVLVDLTPFIGQNVTIRFSTFDCSLGGHFGYAYIDGVCQSFNSGGTATVCQGNSNIFCAPTGVESYTWNGPGLSNFVGQCGTATAPGIYTVTTTLFTGCPGPTFNYTLVDQPPPVASAGPPATVCANNNTVNISGTITGYSATPVWSSGGSGAFTSTANLNTMYTPSNADNAAGTITINLTTAGNGVCPPSSDIVVIDITPAPVVNAGVGGSNCNNNPFPLNGSVTGGATTGTWITSGNGTFLPSVSALNATYTPGPADIAAGSATLTLRSTNNGDCFPVSDTLLIFIRQPATTNAGANQSRCSTSPTIGLSGIIGGGGTTGIWGSSGVGTFAPPNTSLNTVYAITPADITLGQVIFTLTSTNNGPCPAATDTVKMVIVKPSTVTAGPNQFLCATSGSVNLTGAVTGFSNTGSWTGSGNGAFNPAATSLSTSYVFTPADLIAGIVDFTLASTNNGPCASVSDTVRMRVRIEATAITGPSQTLCSTAGSVGLSGTIGGGSSTGIWGSLGTGAFAPSNTSLNTVYAMTPADITLGQVIFTLTSTNNGPCAAVTSTVKLLIIKPATVTAGPNLFLCSTAGSVILTGGVTGFSNTGSWTSSGTGAFNPGVTSLTTAYVFTPADLIAGIVDFSLTSTNNGPCAFVRDSVRMRVRIPATANAGLNQVLCSNAGAVNLSGTITGGSSTGAWTVSGTGGFAPFATALSPTYAITPIDIGVGSLIFTLTSTNNGPCAAVQDTVKMAITNIATITAGPNQYVCSSPNAINLSGSIISPSNSVIWSTGGTGNFSASGATINPTYSLTTADINSGVVTFTISSTNNGPCPVMRDSVMITIKKLAVINAGINQNICSSIPNINLTGSIGGGATTISWTTSGNGSFIPNNFVTGPAYSITPADINSGNVSFTLTSLNNGPCPAVSNTVMTIITKIATVTAGPNLYVCSNATTLNLAGIINSPSNTANWTGTGSGIFLPNAGTVNNTYSFTPADITAGTVTFTLTSTNNGVCPAVKDTVKMRIMRLATVNAGIDKAICSSQGSVTVSGNVSGGGNAGTWTSSGNGSFNPGVTSFNPAYVFTPLDVSAGTVTLVFTSVNSAPCPEVADSVNIAIHTQAQVVAGPSQTLCSVSGSVNLAGSVTGGNGTVLWTAGGTGNFSPNNTAPSTVYMISASDISAGVVNFTLESTNNGSCPKGASTLIVYVKKLATVNAGFDKSICSTQLQVPLQGTVTGVTTSGIWSGNGAGVISPNGPFGSYSVSPADIVQGTMMFVLTSVNNDVCPAVMDTMKLLIETKPTIFVGADTTVCEKHNLISLSYTAASTTTLQWATSGSGIFLPTNAVSATQYSLSSNDKTSGSVLLKLGTSSFGPCGYTEATMNVNILKGPHANFSASSYAVQIPDDPPIQFTNSTGSADTYTWNFGDGIDSPLKDPVHTYSVVGYYQVVLIARNNNGCSDTTDAQITVTSDVKFPNAFTPNTHSGNGGFYDVNDYSTINDVFFPFAKGVVEFDMTIFNRWGELIFKSNDIKIGWDGYFNGKICQQDTYVWTVNMVFFDGKKYNGKGSITLLR